ncbi:unnamed protein product [Durusdinium trenchii]|uniref:Uncharacterized protein n=1 Tax=Durusdinium trenchii TaxID=1381693 RepID=A0ABP0JQC8_9DINO
MATSMALYQDKFVEIYADHIKIKSYYAPVFRSKRINIGKECRVSFATDEELGFTKVDRKGWGMALNNVWWALDMRREFIFGGPKHPGIVITVGRDTFRKGFSVEDGEAAVKVLEGADLRSAVTRLEARMHALEGQNLRSDRRAAELAGLTQALTEEQRALLIRLDRLEDLKRRDALQVPEDRLGRLEQEHRTLALELRLTASVAEEAQQKQQQRIRSLEESMGARLRKLEHGGGEMQAETDPSGRSWWPEVSKSRANDEAKDVSRVCDSLEAKLCGLTASVEEIQKQLVSVSRRCEGPSLSVQVAEPGSPSLEKAGAMPFEDKLEQLEHFCLDLRETLEDRLLLVLADLEKQVPDLLQKFQRESADGAERAEKLKELEVRVEMFCRRMSTQEERRVGASWLCSFQR